MKHTSRLFTALSLSALLFAASNVATAQAPSGAPALTMTAPAPGTVTNQTTTSESTTVVPADTMTTETTAYDNAAPLANTGGEPWMFVLGGLTLAASALLFRRRVGNNV